MSYRILTGLVTLNLLFAGCVATEDNLFDGNDIASNKSFTPFTLVDSNNSTFNSTSLDGMVIVVNFFYTNCPDVCSTVTAELKTLYQEYESEIGNNLSFVSITVDPWRDGPNDLLDYMTYFNTSWTYLTTFEFIDGDFSSVEQIWSDFGIGVVLKESENSTSIEGRGHTVYYDVEHTEGIVIVGKDGLQKVRWDGDNWALDGVRNDLDKILSM